MSPLTCFGRGVEVQLQGLSLELHPRFARKAGACGKERADPASRARSRRGPRRARSRLAEPEPKHHLVVGVHFAGLLEAIALVEADGAAVALTGARVQHLDSGPATEV